MMRVVLIRPRNPLNIGAAARAMNNFGFDDLAVVEPYEAAFREAKSAMAGARVLKAARIYASVADAVADRTLVVGTTSIGHRELQHPVHSLTKAASRLRAAKRAALLFGSEKFGLSNEDMAHCHWLLTIPTANRDESMNLGQAVAVCLYDLARHAAPAVREPKRAKAGEVEQITSMLIQIAAETGYTKERTGPSTELKLRRMVRRLNLTATDTPLWLGLLRQALWKLGR